LSYTFGQVAFNLGINTSFTVDGYRTLPLELETEIIDLTRHYHLAAQEDNIAFALLDLSNGISHNHSETRMAYPFIGIETEWPEGIAPSKKPFLFKPSLTHKSPDIPQGEYRLFGTFYPVPPQ
jgi:hypothetical protein